MTFQYVSNNSYYYYSTSDSCVYCCNDCKKDCKQLLPLLWGLAGEFWVRMMWFNPTTDSDGCNEMLLALLFCHSNSLTLRCLLSFKVLSFILWVLCRLDLFFHSWASHQYLMYVFVMVFSFSFLVLMWQKFIPMELNYLDLHCCNPLEYILDSHMCP